MRFVVERASDLYSDKKPCDGAMLESVFMEKKRRLIGGKGYCYTTEEERYWVIDLDTLHDLIGFMDTIGEDVIISAKHWKSDYVDYPLITIYDGYIEW